MGSADGATVTPGECSFNGNTFKYNLSYARLPEKELTLIAAVYDGNALTGVKVIGTEPGYFEIGGSLSAAGDCAKLMVWDSLTTLKPFMPPVDYHQ